MSLFADREHDRYNDLNYNQGYGNQTPDPYNQPPSGYLPPHQQQPNPNYPTQQNYPGSTYFPPPPTGDNYYNNQQPAQQYAQYNPADYAPGGNQYSPYESTRGMYGDSEANLGASHPNNETYAGDSRGIAPEDAPQPPASAPPDADRRRTRGGGGEADHNVSSPELPSDVNVGEGEREGRDAGTS